MKVSNAVFPGIAAFLVALILHPAVFAIDCDDYERGSGDSLALELVTSDVVTPLDLTAPPGDTDRLFIVERRGTIRVFDLNTNTLLPTPFLDIESQVVTNIDNGLLGMAFHPDYATNGLFYVHYSHSNGDKIIGEYQVSATDPNFADPTNPAERVVLSYARSEDYHEAGSIVFGPDEYLYITSGDGGPAHDENNNAQNPLSFTPAGVFESTRDRTLMVASLPPWPTPHPCRM